MAKKKASKKKAVRKAAPTRKTRGFSPEDKKTVSVIDRTAEGVHKKIVGRTLPELKFPAGESKRLLDVIVEAGFAGSNKEAKRKIQQGGVSVGDAKIEDIAHELPGSGEHLVKVGKRHFVKVIFS